MEKVLLIGGERVVGDGSERQITDPASGKPICKIADASIEQVDSAVRAAAEAFGAWAATPPGTRASMLNALATAMEADFDTLADLEARDCGKPLASVKADELPVVIDVFRFFAGAARTMDASAAGEYVEGFTSFMRRDPVGVVAAISPWNYPLLMAAWKLAAPLAAGCPVILKPSELTPLSTLHLASLMADIFPKGVVNIITGDGPSIGNTLINHPAVEAISVTGSPATGRAALKAAASKIRHTHLELGGKAPVLVLEDADVETLVETLRFGSYFNAGQDCAQPCRIYVADKIYDRVVADLTTAVSTIQTGLQHDAATEMGPIISDDHRRRVAAHVDAALALPHIEATTGGRVKKGSGFFYEPTVLAGSLQNDAITREEVFGPVVSVTRFSTPEQGLAWANDSEYGLGSSVWTRDLSLALEMTRKLRFGMTWVNTHGVFSPEMPWTAMRGSGTGYDMSVHALEHYTVKRHICMAH